MNASELRIGNYAHHNNRWSYRNDDGIEFDFPIEERDFFAAGESTFSFEDNLEPIHLTEEWLLRLGFKKMNVNTYIKDPIVMYITVDKNIVPSPNLGLKTKIKYVHQLQNLYYAFTNKELKVKSTTFSSS